MTPDEAIATMEHMDDVASVGDFSAVLSGVVSDVFYEGVRSNFNDRSNAAGDPWPPRKPPTGTWPLLIKTGRMQEAAVGHRGAAKAVTPRDVTWSVSTPYAIYHMTGTHRMPARRFFELKPAFLEEIANHIAAEYWRMIAGSN